MLTRRHALRFVAVTALALPASLAGAGERIDWRRTPMRLLMVDRPDCPSSAAWRREIAPGYAGSAEGRAAPLLRVDLDGPWPDGLALARRPVVTPTFVLLSKGLELARIEGYPGADAFHPQLAAMLADAERGRTGR